MIAKIPFMEAYHMIQSEVRVLSSTIRMTNVTRANSWIIEAEIFICAQGGITETYGEFAGKIIQIQLLRRW